jgi:hypothetical protein
MEAMNKAFKVRNSKRQKTDVAQDTTKQTIGSARKVNGPLVSKQKGRPI